MVPVLPDIWRGLVVCLGNADVAVRRNVAEAIGSMASILPEQLSTALFVQSDHLLPPIVGHLNHASQTSKRGIIALIAGAFTPTSAVPWPDRPSTALMLWPTVTHADGIHAGLLAALVQQPIDASHQLTESAPRLA